MTETNDSIWEQVDREIITWCEAFPSSSEESIIIDDNAISDLRAGALHVVSLVNSIGLKRRIGKILQSRGYTKTHSNPPTWVKNPPVKEPVREIPPAVLNAYRAILMAEREISNSKEGLTRIYPDINQWVTV
jgi:hypothetical protein